jgi:hypothetical protein
MHKLFAAVAAALLLGWMGVRTYAGGTTMGTDRWVRQ